LNHTDESKRDASVVASGGRVRKYFTNTRAVAAEMSAGALKQLAEDPVTGYNYISHYDALTVGAGYLDIQAAVNSAFNLVSSLPSGTAMSPTVAYSLNTGITTMVTDQTALWGKTALWGASNVHVENAFVSGPTGTTAHCGATALWGANDPGRPHPAVGSHGIMGRSTPAAAAALWGASIVTGQPVLGASNVTDAN
jgi:hypothetical protein